MEWKGLSSSSARRILEEEGENLLPHERARSPLSRLLSLLSEPMLFILLAGGALYFLLGDRTEGLILLMFVFAVLGMAFIQREKSEKALNALRKMAVPRTRVIRDGRQVTISSREVVRGDVLVLSEGDRVPADARLLEGHLFADESMLTGESVPVLKIPGADALPFGRPGDQTSPFVFGGTTLTKGSAIARVEFTGDKSAVGRIGQSLAGAGVRLSPMERASVRFVRMFSVVGIVLSAVNVALYRFVAHRTLFESLLGGVALIMALLPEEIPVILTIFFSLGARRLSVVGVLAKRLSAVETLGSITVLAVDKTGTLTENRMDLVEVDVEGRIFSPLGREALPESFHRLLEYAILATPPLSPDSMEQALLKFGDTYLQGTEHLHKNWNAVKVYGLEPPILAMARVFEPQDGSPALFATKGSPESILDLCHVSSEEAATVGARVTRMATRGYRVLGVAYSHFSSREFPDRLHDVPFSFAGLLAFQDRPRPEVREAIGECRRAGIRVIMMTGDHPVTAKAIAREVGILDAEVITGADLESMGSPLLDRLGSASVCARLAPEQKLRLVQALKEGGECVAMTGDGVNDAPALKAAHVGVAMGLKGTDTARESAALVLLRDSFLDLVHAIRIGRTIADNIRSAVRFAVSVHVPLVVIGLLTVLTGGPIFLTPVDIVLLQFIIDPACSLLYEAEPARKEIMDEPPRPSAWTPFTWSSLKGGIWQGAGVSVIFSIGFLFLRTFHWPQEVLRTILFGALVPSILILILSNRNKGVAKTGRMWSENPVALRLFLAVPIFLLLLYIVPFFRKSLEWTLLKSPGQVMAMAGLIGISALFLWAMRKGPGSSGRDALWSG